MARRTSSDTWEERGEGGRREEGGRERRTSRWEWEEDGEKRGEGGRRKEEREGELGRNEMKLRKGERDALPR